MDGVRREIAGSQECRGEMGRTGARESLATRETQGTRVRLGVTDCRASQEYEGSRASRAMWVGWERRETADCLGVTERWGSRGLRVSGDPREREAGWDPQEVKVSKGSLESKVCQELWGRLEREADKE